MKYRFFTALLLTTALSASSVIEPPRAAIRSFITLAGRCRTTLDTATTDKPDPAYLAITALARKNAKQLGTIETLGEAEVKSLYAALQAGMSSANGVRQQVAGLQTVRMQPPLNALLNTFANTHDSLVKPITRMRQAQRIAARTVVELLYGMHAPLSPKSKQVPAVGDRLSHMMNGNFPTYNWRGAIGCAATKVMGDAIVNELLPAGYQSPRQKLFELMVPPVLAGILHSALLHTPAKRFSVRHTPDEPKPYQPFWAGALKGLLNIPVLTRFCLDKHHPWYKWANYLAYVLPFLIGSTAKKVGVSGVFKSPNNVGNALLDGAVSTAVFEGVPAIVEVLLKKSTKSRHLRAVGRRKSLGKLLRDPLKLIANAWTSEAFY